MNLQRAKEQSYQFCEGQGLGRKKKRRRRRASNIAHTYPYPSTSKHILALGIAYHLSYTASSNLHERILEYLAMEYPY
jgi:hypothetical protein